MKSMFHKITALALAVCMICSLGVLSASAAAPYEEGSYTATVRFLHEEKDKFSMCDPMFCHTADIVVKGDTASITVYVANPVPAFPEQGEDGTVKEVKMTLDGAEYPAVSDMETKAMRKYDADNTLFGLVAGESYPTQALTFTIPAAKLGSLEATPAKIDAYVNVVMNSAQVFRLQVSSIQPLPTETSSHAMQITAVIEAPEPSYEVEIPQSIAMGTLSTEKDNTAAYTVKVKATNLGSGRVSVSAPAAGDLTSGENTLAYANSFGSQQTDTTAELKGAFTVTGADVAAAAAGNYTGTVSFAIAYYAGK